MPEQPAAPIWIALAAQWSRAGRRDRLVIFSLALCLGCGGPGTDELLITEGFGGPLHVIRGGTLPGAHDPLPDRHLVFYQGGPTGSVCGEVPCVVDYDGDGFEDLVAWAGDPDTAGRDGWILRGFDVPWEEDVWW
jgi:hypothetical protein